MRKRNKKDRPVETVYIRDIAKKYGLDCRTALSRLDRAGIKPAMVTDKNKKYYCMSGEIREIMSRPLRFQRDYHKQPFPRPAYEFTGKLPRGSTIDTFCVTVEGMK